MADYLGVADTVIGMVDFEAVDFTHKSATLNIEAPPCTTFAWPMDGRRMNIKRLHPGKIKVRDENRIQYGGTELRLGAVEQLYCRDQAWSVAQAIRWIHENLDDGVRLSKALDELEQAVAEHGIELLCPRHAPCGDIIRIRRQEIAAAINRLRDTGR